jgi:exonuclease SbcC
MLIEKIEIENIKTHKNTSISFNKGLNILYGNNGAGKSTVLEMIGFVLFDFLKSKTHHADYVRAVKNDNPEYGTVKIWINGRDDKIYQIMRTIGKTEIEVRDEKGTVISPQINTVSKFKAWIKKQLGIKYEINLETLFNTAIGIPQGMIVNSFLMSPKDRKEYFDEIFQIDIYEDYWNNLGSIESKYREEINEIQKKISGLIGETKEKDNILATKQKLNEDISNVKKELESSKKEKKKRDTELEELKTIKAELEEITSVHHKLDIEKQNEEKNLSVVQQQLSESLQAEKICKDTKNAYEEYKSLNQAKNNLIAKNERLTELKEEQNELNEKYQKLENNYNKIKERIEDAEASQEKLQDVEPKYQQFLSIEDQLPQIKEKLAIINSNENILQKKQNKQEELTKQVESLKKEVDALPKLQQDLKNINKLEHERDSLKVEISSLENDLSFFESNQHQIENKLCPFFGQKCKNMQEGEFDINVFIKEIRLKKEELHSKNDKLVKVRNQITNKDKIQSEIEVLKRKQIKQEEYKKQIEALEIEIAETTKKISEKSEMVQTKNQMEGQKEKLKPFYDDYLIHKKQSQDLKELQEKLSPFQNKLEKAEQAKTQLKAKVEKYQHIPTKLAEVRSKINKLENDYNEYQKNINEANKIDTRREKVNKSKEKLKELKVKCSKKLEKKQELSRKFNEKEYQELQDDISQYKGQIIKLEENLRNLDERLDDINENLKNLEEKENKLEEFKEEELNVKAERKFVSKIRTWLREFKPKMRTELIRKVNNHAKKIYRKIRDDQNTSLDWDKNYQITVLKAKRRKKFIRLSGGEKMAAALAIRLAILKTLTSAKFAIFDEPTTNLDAQSRNNLSKYINNIEGFNQLFVISHDDSFKNNSDYVIKLTKDDNEKTHVKYITNIGN